ncbi:uncharacterized protein LOC134222541 [Armigeres subalbatus]|uniref:uncharacterized protein LOC134222541 n=1 Tax=Armigeres subalbatus TaxID=124917 RepID=UPI002ED1C1C8
MKIIIIANQQRPKSNFWYRIQLQTVSKPDPKVVHPYEKIDCTGLKILGVRFRNLGRNARWKQSWNKCLLICCWCFNDRRPTLDSSGGYSWNDMDPEMRKTPSKRPSLNFMPCHSS